MALAVVFLRGVGVVGHRDPKAVVAEEPPTPVNEKSEKQESQMFN